MAVNPNEFDCSGWATRNNLLCADGRTIRQNAFKDNDGCKVPVVWSHRHDDVQQVLGHAILENRDEGVYAYVKFNGTENGKAAKEVVHNGDVCAFSIYANQLKHSGRDVIHGLIREVSLVLAGANPGALIDTVVMAHSEDEYEEACIYNPDDDSFNQFKHSEEEVETEVETEVEPEIEPQPAVEEEIKEEPQMVTEENLQHAEEGKEETIGEIFDTLTDKQKQAVYAIVAAAVEEGGEDEGGKEMKHNVFEQDVMEQDNVLSHADQEAIIALAQSSSVGSLQKALAIYAEENEALAHNFEKVDELFPEYKQLMPGAPELITRDMTWVDGVISGVHKSPYGRIKTRQANAKIAALKAKGYKKGEKKKYMDTINLIQRQTDSQTIYIKDYMDRDDILDITDFDAVEYNWGVMRMTLNETLAMAIMVGDGREDTDPDKIKEDKIRPIWKDHDLYAMHVDVDLEKAKTTLQGTNTNLYFSENYIYAEAIIEAALYAREKYKGSGKPAFYCDPHLVNVMLLARDRNGRRIYDTVNDLVAALNVSKIETAEQFAGLTRKTEIAKGDAKDGDVKQLLGIFVNLSDYTYGCVKGGEITKFSQFDIDYNQEKMLLETRGCGALARIQSAIVLEIPTTDVEDDDDDDVTP